MGLMIACILIYQFEMHWAFYVVGVVAYFLENGSLINKLNNLTDLVWGNRVRLESLGEGMADMGEKILEDLWKVDERINR